MIVVWQVFVGTVSSLYSCEVLNQNSANVLRLSPQLPLEFAYHPKMRTATATAAVLSAASLAVAQDKTFNVRLFTNIKPLPAYNTHHIP